MTECAQCGDEFHRTVACSVCNAAYCLSHRRRSEHDCVDATNPQIRSLSSDGWSRLSHLVNRFLFILFSLTLALMLVELLL